MALPSSTNRRANWVKLLRLEQRPRILWPIGYATYHGINDRVPIDQATTLSDSLQLIRVKEVTLQVHVPGGKFNDLKRVVRARFEYAGLRYALKVTDPKYERAYLSRADDTHPLGESFLTVSLGEPHTDGYAYKLVAAIIERTNTEQVAKR